MISNKFKFFSITFLLIPVIFLLNNILSKRNKIVNNDYMIDYDIGLNNKKNSKKKSEDSEVFQLRSFKPNNKTSENSIKALTHNPFKDIGATENVYNEFPRSIKFTGILEVGDQKGVQISAFGSSNIFYLNQKIYKEFKIVSIDSKKAEIIISNGFKTNLVKLEED